MRLLSLILLVLLMLANPGLAACGAQQSRPASRPAIGLPPRGPDGRVISGKESENAIPRGEAALRALAQLSEQAGASQEEIGWGRYFYVTSLILGNADDGRLIARTLADPKSDPSMRAAAAGVVLYGLNNFYADEPELEDELTPADHRAIVAPFWQPIADHRDEFLAAARQLPADDDKTDKEEANRTIREALLLAALDSGDEATLLQVVDLAAEDGELYAKIIELGARHEPRLVRADPAHVTPILERLGSALKDGHHQAVAAAAAALGESGASLADDLVLAEKAPPDGAETQLSLDTSRAMELIGPPATPHLLPLLQAENFHTRLYAVKALADVYAWFPIFHQGEPRKPPPEVIEAVWRLQDDPNQRVRKEAEMTVFWWTKNSDPRRQQAPQGAPG